MSRFFVTPDAIGKDYIEITEKGDIKHLSKVLRLKPGDEIEVSDSSQYEYTAEIVDIAPDFVLCKITDKQRCLGEPELEVTLFQGVPKQGKMETIIQKTVELGISAIVPVFTARTVVLDKGRMENRLERWQKISAEAVKQCGRGKIPAVEYPLSFEEMTEALKNDGYDLVLFLYEDEEKTTIKDVLRGKEGMKKVALLIGPEGGFAEEEAEILREIASCASLGKTTLRTETAGMAALAMTMYELEL
ncbi:MAG: 16S rRNA (uracil(1498)-N(3))-methyltransferase [Clostridiales bacterium]|nr:16S rRNA (uracil(1498)-N(3))-methyltransferase [Clostridiales bacterium]